MTKAIGPSFADELRTARLGGLPVSWGADGAISFDDKVTPEQRAAVLAVYAAHDPDADPRSYRDKRAAAYIVELRKPNTKETPAFQTTAGDVLDIVITQVEAMRVKLGADATAEFAGLIAAIADIKARFPKA